MSRWLLPLVFLSVALPACGSSDDDSAATGGSSGAGGSGGSGGSSASGGSGGSSASGGSSGGGGKCSVSALTCGDILTATELTNVEPDVTSYSEDGSLPCSFKLPESSGGIFQVFCGGEDLLASQLANADAAYPGDAMETDTIGTKSYELNVGAPGSKGSTAEVGVLTTNGKYVFTIALNSAYSDIAISRQLAELIDANLSAL